MEAEVTTYEKYRRDLKFMLVCSGLWPDYDKHPRPVRIFLNFCSAFTTAFVTFGVVSFLFKFATNMSMISRGLGLIISYSSTSLRVSILLLHQDDLRKLSNGVSASFARDLKVPEYRAHLLAHLHSCAKFFYAVNYFVASSLLFTSTIPLQMLIRYGKYVRIYPMYFPFTYEPGGLVHWLLYGSELLAGFFLWTVTCGVESSFGLYTLHIVGELKILSHKFQQLSCNSDYARDLKECIRRHIELLEAKRILERIFGFLAIWMAVTCAICLCALIFQATQTKQLSVLKVCHLISYILIKLVQGYSYAWCGSTISFESKACLESMYNAKWSGSGDMKFMKDVLIVLSQRPMVFTAKGVVLVEMGLFMKVVNTTVSYFFLLQTLDEKLA